MKQVFIKKENSKNVTIFFLGYGQSADPFTYLKDLSKQDLCVVFDYTDPNFDTSIYKDYESITLISWSMGVMLAPLFLSQNFMLYKIDRAIAINGTIEGIDDNLGIPLNMWNATIDALSDDSVLKFYKRMCNRQDLDEYLSLKPNRSVDSLKKELINIREISSFQKVEDFSYNVAFVGSKDRIFNPNNQKASWEHHQVKLIENAWSHYDKELFSLVFLNEY